MVFYKCDICGCAVQHPAVIMDRDSALYGGRETVDVCPKCMAAICQAVSELQEVAEGAQCLS